MDSPIMDDLNSLLGPSRNHNKYQRWFLTFAWSQLAFFCAALGFFLKYRVGQVMQNGSLILATLIFFTFNALMFTLVLQFSKTAFSNHRFSILLYLIIQLVIAVTLTLILNFSK